MSFYEDRIFPYILTWGTRGFRRNREQLVARASGRVLEVGIGNGENIPFYSQAAEQVVGLEPNQAMLKMAEQRAADIEGIKFEFTAGSAHSLPYPDNSFDTVIFCLVLCTIPDPVLAAREALRVLKPGGQLLVLEHVQSSKSWVARLQQQLNPAWKVACCGCNLNRDSERVLREAGFLLQEWSRYQHPKAPALVASVVEGVAIKGLET